MNTTQSQMLITTVVPAAGASKRLGQDKRQLIVGDKPLLKHVVSILQQGGVHRVVVVLEPNSVCQKFFQSIPNSSVIINPHPERGMLSSIQCGLRALSPAIDAAMILPGDHPFVTSEVVRKLLATYEETRALLTLPRYGKKRGHPIILDRRLFAEALQCDEQIGLRQLVWNHENDACEVFFPGLEDLERDIDVPDDLTRLKG